MTKNVYRIKWKNTKGNRIENEKKDQKDKWKKSKYKEKSALKEKQIKITDRERHKRIKRKGNKERQFGLTLVTENILTQNTFGPNLTNQSECLSFVTQTN
jgi:hypothetical protein